MKSQIKRTIAILLLVCFLMSITITAVSAAATYQVGVKTGTADDAGTDASVYISLVGTKATSPWLLLDDANNNFEKGQLEFFDVITGDLGNIDMIKIRMDHKGKNPDWNLDYITVGKFYTNQKWTFPYYNWITDNYIRHINKAV